MDTGNYMANQMDDLITNGLHQMDEFCNELETEISKFIEEKGFDWKAIEIFTEYREKYSKGFYVSFTCRLIIKQFEDKLKLIYP